MMNPNRSMWVAALALAVAGCGGSGASQRATSPDAPRAPVVIDAPSSPSARAMASPARSTPTVPAPAAVDRAVANIPAGAQWMIFCDRISGPGHIERSMSIEKQLRSKTSMKDWHLMHQSDGTLIYYGYYGQSDPNGDAAARAEAARQQRDLDAVRAFVDPSGRRLFSRAIAVTIESPDPDAPPEWNLVNAPKTAFWSVQESAFTRPDLRKQAAVDRVREIRAAGQVAFYYHGESVSSVCVGVWPKEAVSFAEVNKAAVPDAEEHNENYSLVVDTIGLPDQAIDAMAGGRANVGVARAVKTVKDPTLLQASRDFPHMTNYEPDYVRVKADDKGTMKYVPRPGVIVRIPREAVGDATADTGAASPADAGAPDLRLIDPNAGSSGPLGNRLQGIGR